MPERKLVLSVTIKDCEVQDFRVGGNGGQKVNKTSTGQRVIHHPSGARGEARQGRSQLTNKREAFIKMTNTAAFKLWLNEQLMEVSPAERVAEDMKPSNLRVETRQDGKWVEQ